VTSADEISGSEDDDVEDPFGGSPQDYRDTATLLGGLVEELAGMAWPEVGHSPL
jgi:hypothetical protein